MVEATARMVVGRRKGDPYADADALEDSRAFILAALAVEPSAAEIAAAREWLPSLSGEDIYPILQAARAALIREIEESGQGRGGDQDMRLFPEQTDSRAMDRTFRWTAAVDERDISDASREWVAAELEVVALPGNKGALRAALEVAFDAGRVYQLDLENDL